MRRAEAGGIEVLYPLAQVKRSRASRNLARQRLARSVLSWEHVGCRERKARWYNTAPWVAHRMIEELAFCAVYSAVLACVLFFSMRLHGSFAAFWNPYFLSFCFGIGAPP